MVCRPEFVYSLPVLAPWILLLLIPRLPLQSPLNLRPILEMFFAFFLVVISLIAIFVSSWAHVLLTGPELRCIDFAFCWGNLSLNLIVRPAERTVPSSSGYDSDRDFDDQGSDSSY